MEIVVVLLMCTTLGFAAKDELVMTTDCLCPGLEFSYFNCTVNHGLFTIWTGSAFGDGCEIILPHVDFNTGTAIGSCNSRAITAHGIGGDNGCYISQLTVRPSMSSQGEIIECVANNNNVEMTIGRIVLKFTQEPPPAPDNIAVSVRNFNELTFKWSPPNLSCPALSYSTTTENCGICATDYHLTVTACSDYSRINVCRFTVQSVICGNITGASSVSDKLVNLQVPEAPVVSVVPHYLSGHLPFLLKIVTSFSVVNSFEVTDGISGAANFYKINYFDALSNETCEFANASCNSTMCTHIFNASLSTCPSSTSITLTVVATNIIGEGSPSVPKQIASENNLVDIKFDTTLRSLTCIYRNQPVNTIKHCNATITYGTNCDKTLGIYGNMNKSSTVTTPPIDSVPGVSEYCYSVSSSSGNETVVIEGNQILINNIVINNSVNTGEIIGMLVSLIVIIVIVIAITLFIKKRVTNHQLPPLMMIKFSNERNLSSLTKILKVFQDYKVDIICMNTTWDISRHRDKYLFRFCCTTEQKMHLENQLGVTINEVLESPNQEGHFVAELSVSGALLATLDKFYILESEKEKVNVGVNINPNRQSINGPNYEDNLLSCRCFEKKLKSLLENLEMSGAKYVRSEYIEPAKRNIHFWIMNEDDAEEALLIAFKAFSDLAICITGVNSQCHDKASEDSKAKYYV